jgi:RHS repeat-associated protein
MRQWGRPSATIKQNRLVVAESSAGVPPAVRMREEWSYLPDGRWIQRIVSTNNGSSYVPQYTNRYVWDGKVLLAVLDHTNGLVLSFMRGLDLSGSEQGAGGVGGLLAVRVGPAGPSGLTGSTHFVAFDGNGNVSALVSASDGNETAWYEYGPFGELIRATGPMAKTNPFRFSTKYQDDESDLVYYGYRYYNPSTGRWLSRDPVAENDGPNIYAFLRNDSLNKIDFLGLEWIIERFGQPRAFAYVRCGDNDTWDALARKLHLDTSDYQRWAQTGDQKPIEGKRYTIPNTIYVDFGELKVLDQVPINIISIWRSMAQRDKAAWASKGFRVSMNEGVIDEEITGHLASRDIYGYVYIGHGAESAIINTYSHLGDEISGVIPDRYTGHGIAFMNLKSCYSADRFPVPGRHYRFNAWESNVATRGWFTGYTGLVNTLNEVFLWATTRGKNDGGISGPP